MDNFSKGLGKMFTGVWTTTKDGKSIQHQVNTKDKSSMKLETAKKEGKVLEQNMDITQMVEIKDDKIINNIFNQYFTTKHHSSGTGLGLYMS